MQSENPEMIMTRYITIPQLTGKEKRRAYVYVPDEARDNPDYRYPVLYMFDGQNVFFDSHATYGKSWGMLDYLQANNVPLIVAAVECNHHPDNGRLKDGTKQSYSSLPSRWALPCYRRSTSTLFF